METYDITRKHSVLNASLLCFMAIILVFADSVLVLCSLNVCVMAVIKVNLCMLRTLEHGLIIFYPSALFG